MTLAKIPKKTLNILRRLASNFLWNGHGKKHKFHLSSWASLTTPKRAGGWGLRDLPLFNTALLASSLWRALNHNSIWHRIVAAKYLGSQRLCDWLRKPSLQQSRASTFWKGMIASSPVILHWLRWKPGTGTDISLGRDQIVGLDEKSLLHSDLRLKLGSSNYFFLAHVRTLTDNPSWPDNWLSSSDLNLDGKWASDWNLFSTALKSAGISLTADPDSLLWTGGDGSGLLTVKNIYVALFSHFHPESFPSWLRQIWNWKVPLKLKLFVWLAGQDKVLTWDSLRRRGWEGPGICPLCRHAQEDIHHLLIHCEFSREVWRFLLTHLNLHSTWSGRTVTDCFINWLKIVSFRTTWLPKSAGTFGSKEILHCSKTGLLPQKQ
jgi:hypothetical protein